MLSREIQNFIADYHRYLEEKEREVRSGADKIHVDEIASKVAGFYEKVRNVVDYREEHLLRRGTIERILRRRIFLKDFNKNFAEALIKELIRAGHLPNDSILESKIPEVQKIIDSLIYFLERGSFKDAREKEKISNWLINIFTSAIEEELAPPVKDRMIARVMFDVLKNKLILKNIDLTDQEKNAQLFVAIERALFRPDKAQLELHLLRFSFPNWGKFSEEELMSLAQNLSSIRNSLKTILDNPFGNYFLKLCNKEKIVFWLVGDLILSEVPLNDKDENLEKELKTLYERRYTKESSRLNKMAFLSVASFFISKILVAVAIQIPLDRHFVHSFSWVNTLIDIAFPPFLMLAIVTFIKLPAADNFELVLNSVKAVIFSGSEQKYTIAAPKKRKWFNEIILYLAYLAVMAAILYWLTKFLLWLNFSIASIIIFIIFTSMVIATGVKVYNRSQEMSLKKEKATFLGFIMDLIIVPFMTLGKWFITGLSKFNILVLVLSFLIELPFQIFVQFLENFRSFIKAKKEETN